MPTELYIKNMVCGRCILAVEQLLQELDLHPLEIQLGIVKLQEDGLPEDKQQVLSQKLQALGFGLLDNAKSRLINRIKSIIINKIHYPEHSEPKVNWSELLSSELHHDYSYLSSLFSSVEGITIEQYIIRQKIEKVKELLFYDELNLNEISWKLGYSSAQHLSAQFKKVTGQTPSQFKNSRDKGKGRKPLDSVQ